MSKKNKAAANAEVPIEQEPADPSQPLVEGLVLQANRGQYRVQTADGIVICQIRGRLRKQFEMPVSQNWHYNVQRMKIKARDPITVGNHVRLLLTAPGEGIIEAIVPNDSAAFTRDDTKKGKVTSVAGVDQMIIVFATRDPAPHLRLLDRFLVIAEAQEINAVICINKLDLGLDDWLAARLDIYRNLGYPVVLASAERGAGLEQLRDLLAEHTSAFLGGSGVGKSSLMNALEQGLHERVSAISTSTHKGRHTTTGSRLIALSGGGYVADTAGIRTLALGGVAAGQLDWCFREFRPYLGSCRLQDCRHIHEPDCCVREAAELGEIDDQRYDSYCILYEQGGNARGKAWLDAVSQEDHRQDKLAYTPHPE